MPLLKKILDDYTSNVLPYEYIIGLENGEVINLKFKKDHLKHLLGLHHAGFNQVKGSLVYQRIKKGRITYTNISGNDNFSQVENRVLKFMEIKNLLDYNKSNLKITKFNKDKLTDCKLKSKYILYDKQTDCVLHLGIGHNKVYYPETFIVEDKKLDRYTVNQDIVNIEYILKIDKGNRGLAEAVPTT